MSLLIRNKLLTLICIYLFVQPLILFAQEANVTVSGIVYEMGNRKPFQAAIVSIREIESITAVTEADGTFSLTLPGPGNYTVIATALGAANPETQTLQLDAGVKPPSLTFYLRPATILPEVVVSAERNPNQVSKTVVKGEEMRKIAGSSGDPLKSLSSLPGVATSNSGGSAPAIRGSGPGDNFYYADSIPVGKVFHFGGLSVFNGDLIEDFNLYSAAFAPYYDNVTGAILDVTLRNPRTDRMGAKINISLTGADFLIEGPASDNQSFYIAARRSYFDLLIHSISNKGVTVQIPNYWDFQGKYIWNVNADNRLSAHMTGSGDAIRLEIASDSDLAKTQPDLAGSLSSMSSSTTQAVAWDSRLSSTINNKVIFGHRTGINEASIGSAGRAYIVTNSNFVREKITVPVTDNHELTLSTNASNNEVGLDLDFKNCPSELTDPCDLSTAPRVQLADTLIATLWDASVQERWHIFPTFTLIGGLRHSKDNYLNQSYTEPRVGMEWNWTEETLLSAGWGQHNQQPSGQQIAPNFGNTRLTHIRADHSVVGVSQKLGIDWSWKAEAYYKKLSDLVVSVKDPGVNYVNGGSGAAWGTELLIKKEETEQLSGWLSLTLARSERRNDLTGESFRFEYDQPINATLIANYKLTQEWSIGGKWAYTSGRPYTPITGTSGPYPGEARPKPDYAPINSGTLPDYHRLDLRIDRHLLYNTWKLNAYFELNNVYQRQNIVGYDYGPNYDRKDPVVGFAIPFSFGVQGEF